MYVIQHVHRTVVHTNMNIYIKLCYESFYLGCIGNMHNYVDCADYKRHSIIHAHIIL